jgi:hypothetical protein
VLVILVGVGLREQREIHKENPMIQLTKVTKGRIETKGMGKLLRVSLFHERVDENIISSRIKCLRERDIETYRKFVHFL